MTFTPVKHSIPTNLRQVEVLDVLMGSGKTHESLRYIENLAISDSNVRWIYCTEFLSEIESRAIQSSCAVSWTTPVADECTSKKEHLIDLLCCGTQLIAVTHELWVQCYRNEHIQQLINEKGYCLFLDETIDCISASDIPYEDFLWHKESGRLSIDYTNYGKVEWVDSSVDKYTKLAVDKIISVQGVLHAGFNGGSLSLVNIEDAVIFNMFHRMILATYNFPGTIMESFLTMKNIKWTECTDIVCGRITNKSDIRSKILFVNKHDRAFSKLKLSSGWYEDKATAEHFSLINRTIRNIGDSLGCKGSPDLLGYTLPAGVLGTQSNKRSVQPVGYSHKVCMVGVDGKEIPGSVDKARSGHVPCNTRASNAYASKRVMIHIYDRYPSVPVYNFLHAYDVKFDREIFAVNELIQWLWRSAIRNGQEIHVAILSQRMREYFCKWLEK